MKIQNSYDFKTDPAGSSSSLSLYTSSGESADAVPHYQKLCSRDSHIWGIRRGQHSRSAMAEPRPGWTTFLIMVSPLPGKYELHAPHRGHRFTHIRVSVTVSGDKRPPTLRPRLRDRDVVRRDRSCNIIGNKTKLLISAFRTRTISQHALLHPVYVTWVGYLHFFLHISICVQ